MNDRQQRENYLRAYHDLIMNQPWLLNDAGHYIAIEEYLGYLYRKNDYQSFSRFQFPWGYHPIMLNDYKEKLVWISHPINEGTALFAALFQVTQTLSVKVYFNYVAMTDRIVCHLEIYAVSPREVKSFLDKNEKYNEISEQKAMTALGFNTQK